MYSPLKCLVVGGRVGKSCLLMRRITGSFPSEYVPTIWDTTQDVLRISLWDTASNEEYTRLRPLTYPQTDVFLICYDPHSEEESTSKESVLNLWLPELQRYMPSTPIIIVGMMTPQSPSPVHSRDLSWKRALEWPQKALEMKKRQKMWRIKHVWPLLRRQARPSKPLEDGRSPMMSLPDELMLKIFSYLDTPDLAAVARVSMDFHRIAGDFSVWKNRVKRGPVKLKNAFSEREQMELMRQYPTIKEFRFCDSLSGEGVDELFLKVREVGDQAASAPREGSLVKRFRKWGLRK